MYVYGGRGGGGGLEVLKCFVKEGQNFFSTCFVCVLGGGGGGVSFRTSPSVKKITDPPPINK